MKNYMKSKKYLLRGFVLCLCAAGSFTGSACSANNAKDEKPAPLPKRLSHLPKSLGLLYLFRNRYSKTR